MARKLANKTNVQAPAGDYPFGRIKDNPGDNSGTPVNEEVYGDLHQFFEKLMHDVGISFNGLPENNASGFQFIEALAAYIRHTAATDTQRGTVERATQAEVNAGTDALRYLTPALIAGATAIIGEAALKNRAVTTAKLADGAVTPSKLANNAVTPGKIAANAVDSDQYVDGSIDDEHLAQARVKVAPGTPQLVCKVLEIGDWNMEASWEKTVYHGTDFSKVRAVHVVIRKDSDNIISGLVVTPGIEQVEAGLSWHIFEDRLFLKRASGNYKSSSYSATAYNRGWVTITYQE